MLGINNRIVKIMLDPGHGGRDPGVVNHSNGQKESDANLDACLTLKYLIQKHKPNWKVYLTRTTDTDLVPGEAWNQTNISRDRMKRMALANALDCDVFISVHYDMESIGYRYGCYHTDNPQSIGLARALTSGLAPSAGKYKPWIRSQKEVRFGALYVRFFKRPATALVELGPVRRLTRQQRIDLLTPVSDRLIDFVEKK